MIEFNFLLSFDNDGVNAILLNRMFDFVFLAISVAT